MTFKDFGEYNPHDDNEIEECEKQIEKDREEIERYEDMENPVKYKVKDII